jgi:hypothetical protein
MVGILATFDRNITSDRDIFDKNYNHSKVLTMAATIRIYVGQNFIAVWDRLGKRVIFKLPNNFNQQTDRGSAPTEDDAIALAIDNLNQWLLGLGSTPVDTSSARLD